MSRFVSLRRTGLAAGPAEPPDTFSRRLAKYVPGDFLILYTTAIAAFVSFNLSPHVGFWFAIGSMLFVSILVEIYFFRNAPSGQVKTMHLVLSPLAFLGLAYPIAAPLLGSWFIGCVAVAWQFVVAGIALVWDPEEKL